MPPSGRCASRIQRSNRLRVSVLDRLVVVYEYRCFCSNVTLILSDTIFWTNGTTRCGPRSKPAASFSAFAIWPIVALVPSTLPRESIISEHFPVSRDRQADSCGRDLSCLRELFSSLLRSGIQKNSHPILQRQELPDLHRPILGATSVFLHKPANRFWPKQTALADIGFREKVVDHLPQVVRQPVVHWCGETCFRLPQDFGRQNIAHRTAENVFRHGPEESFELEIRR